MGTTLLSWSDGVLLVNSYFVLSPKWNTGNSHRLHNSREVSNAGAERPAETPMGAGLFYEM